MAQQPHSPLQKNQHAVDNTPRCCCCKGIYGLIIMAIYEGFWCVLFFITIIATTFNTVEDVVLFLMDTITAISFVLLIFCIRSVREPQYYKLNLIKYSMLWYIVEGVSECVRYGIFLDSSVVTGEDTSYQVVFYAVYFGLAFLPYAIIIYLLWTWYRFIANYNVNPPRKSVENSNDSSLMPAAAVLIPHDYVGYNAMAIRNGYGNGIPMHMVYDHDANGRRNENSQHHQRGHERFVAISLPAIGKEKGNEANNVEWEYVPALPMDVRQDIDANANDSLLGQEGNVPRTVDIDR